MPPLDHRFDRSCGRLPPPMEDRLRTRVIVVLGSVLSLLLAGAVMAALAADKDTLVIALDTLGAQVMDPIFDTRAPHAHYQAPIWDSLVGFDVEKGGIGPGVAERWERAADGKSWTFYLRKGLKFHNGDAVTGHDVKWSLERIMTPESISSGAAALRRAIDHIEVLDDHTVRVHTKGVIPHFAASLSRAVFMEGTVMPKKYIETVGVPGTMQAVFQFWGLYKPEVKGSPLADVRVREALSLAIDRQQIIDHVMAKQARLPLPFATFRYSIDLDISRWEAWSKKALRYDPARAKQLLAEAGHSNGFKMTFWNTALPGTPFMIQIGEALAGFWEKIGVKVDMKTVEWGVFDPMGRGEQKGLVGTASMYRTAGRPEPIPRYATSFVSKGVQHVFGDPQSCPALCVEADKAYEAIVAEKDDAKRTAATNRMIELVAKSWIAVPIVEGMGTWAVNPKSVGYFKPIPGRHEFGDVTERMPRPEAKPWP